MAINEFAINRTLQDKINQLTDSELLKMANDYIGKQILVLWNRSYTIETIERFEILPFSGNNGFGNLDGDKNILFDTELRTLNLLDFALVGDTLNVRQKKNEPNPSYVNLMVSELINDENSEIESIEFEDGDKIFWGKVLSRAGETIQDRVLPMVMDIGWLENYELIQFEQDFQRYDILDFGDKIYWIVKVGRVFNPDERLIYFAFLNNKDELDTGTFRESELQTFFSKTPDVVKIESGDVFENENARITINKIYRNPTSLNKILVKKTNKVDYTRFGKLSGLSYDETEIMDNLLEHFLLSKFTLVKDIKEEPKPLNMEGDFIGEFLNNNASDLLELEKNNRPLFDVVEMTLNLLNKKFGKGEEITDKVDVVIDNAEEIIKSVQGKDPNLIGLKEIEVLANEGSPNIKGNKYTSWTEFTNALKPLVEIGVGGYNKVKFKATFDDGRYIIERVDVGENNYNPNLIKVGEYIDRPFGMFDNLDDDIDKYVWDDEIIITEEGEQEPTREDVENQIKALNISLMFEDDQERIDEINEKINALNITLTII